VSVFTVAFLFSCSKNAADISNPAANESVASNKPAQSANDNIIHAVPFEATLFVPRANGGTGENVELTGFTNFVYQLSMNENGFTMPYHDNVHQVKGVGAVSGEKFVASGGTNGVVRGSWVNEKWIGTTISQMRVIGQHTRFTVTYKYHITVISNGTVIVNSIEQTADCNN
jgi:hypothetical protein